MNLYFLVEGKTERKVYPRWIRHLIPSLTRVYVPGEVVEYNYYLISGMGFPRLLDVALSNSIEDINDSGRYDYFLIVLDADEVTVDERVREVEARVAEENLEPGNCQIQIIVQNRCMETWFLGNRRVFSRNPTNPELVKCVQFYNVFANDPELMYKPDLFEEPCAQFHFKYLRLMLAERNIRYTKEYPRDVVEPHYIEQLQRRIQDNSGHLPSLQVWFNFSTMINQRVERNQYDTE
jgi:hypothetical protein